MKSTKTPGQFMVPPLLAVSEPSYGAHVRALREARGMSHADVVRAIHAWRWPGVRWDHDAEHVAWELVQCQEMEAKPWRSAHDEMGLRWPYPDDLAGAFGLTQAETDALFARGREVPDVLEEALLNDPGAWEEVRALLARRSTRGGTDDHE